MRCSDEVGLFFIIIADTGTSTDPNETTKRLDVLAVNVDKVEISLKLA